MGETLKTALTAKLGIKYPIMLAGMSGVSHSDLVAAVSMAGGIGTIGGLTLSPKVLRREIAEVKAKFGGKKFPFGVDLAIPKIGDGARKTNHDYTHGHLPELIDIIIEEGASIFVVAVGVCPPWAVEKLHNAGIPIGNMIGAPKHVPKALEAGADIIICQGTEGGGHTGEIGTMALLPACVEKCKGKKSKLDGSDIIVVGAGGISDGKGLAAALNLGAEGVWVGTRFVASKESHGSDRHKEALVGAEALNTMRTLIYSGRPLRTFKSDYVNKWENERKEEIEELCEKGIVPFAHDMQEAEKNDTHFDLAGNFPLLFGQGCGTIHEVLPAAQIIENMMTEAIQVIRGSTKLIAKL